MTTQTTNEEKAALVQVIFDAMQVRPHFDSDGPTQQDGINAFHRLLKETKYESL